MGGRGASSGVSYGGKAYGSQYHKRLERDNIKFISKNTRQSEALMETMTPGRIYVEVGGEDILRVVTFDEDNKRNRVIERDKRSGEWHVHEGYFHAEFGAKRHGQLTDNDRRLLDKVKRLWENK